TNSDISTVASHALEVNVGPEVLAGSTRLKSGTAQKLVLNMISTMTMIGVGKVYDNLMVDLKATNYKLEQRSIHIIEEICGLTFKEAQELYIKADNDIKIAIVMNLCNTTKSDAQSRLVNNNGIVKKAIQS
ncbi:N-acetylmuramic acid 6-phosphate etherase, partial [Streptococcus equi]|nr:N-acetylmuramic acid 6-phosphate etherase [Streptococcus equi]